MFPDIFNPQFGSWTLFLFYKLFLSLFTLHVENQQTDGQMELGVFDMLNKSTKTCIDTTSYTKVIVGSSSFTNPATFIYTIGTCLIGTKLVSKCSDETNL